MKKTHKCPKCESRDVFIVRGFSKPFSKLPAELMSFDSIPADRYVCGRCGYSEEWIDESLIDTVRRSKNAEEIIEPMPYDDLPF